MEHSRTISIRIAVMGSSAVGKSCLCLRFISGKYVAEYSPTIVDTYQKECVVDDTSVNLDIMDTSGAEEYIGWRDGHIETADGILLVYSVTSRLSFDALKDFRRRIALTHENTHWFPVVVVGTKKDDEGSRVISTNEGNAFFATWKFPFFEILMDDIEDLSKPFYELVRQIFRSGQLKRNKKKKKKNCVLV